MPEGFTGFQILSWLFQSSIEQTKMIKQQTCLSMIKTLYIPLWTSNKVHWKLNRSGWPWKVRYRIPSVADHPQISMVHQSWRLILEKRRFSSPYFVQIIAQIGCFETDLNIKFVQVIYPWFLKKDVGDKIIMLKKFFTMFVSFFIWKIGFEHLKSATNDSNLSPT